jgi:hypothetical protein
MTRPQAAIDALTSHQVQCDEDGVMIQVSRQALDEVLQYLAAPLDEQREFDKAWNARPWITEEEADKDRAWRWWQARASLALPSRDRGGET